MTVISKLKLYSKKEIEWSTDHQLLLYCDSAIRPFLQSLNSFIEYVKIHCAFLLYPHFYSYIM